MQWKKGALKAARQLNTWPPISQFGSLKIRRPTDFILQRNLNPNIFFSNLVKRSVGWLAAESWANKKAFEKKKPKAK